MATVTAPLVLDSTLNTTDNTPVNLADVMQSGLAAIASAVGAIPNPTAANVSFDDTSAGLGVSNVQDAIDALNDGLVQNTTLLGSTDISGIGDGTVTGAIDEIMSDITIKVAVLSATITPNVQDADTIGYRTSETSKVVIADLPGYPAGKNIIAMVPVCKQSSVTYRNAILNIDNINCLRACSVLSETFDVRIYVLYTET